MLPPTLKGLRDRLVQKPYLSRSVEEDGILKELQELDAQPVTEGRSITASKAHGAIAGPVGFCSQCGRSL